MNNEEDPSASELISGSVDPNSGPLENKGEPEKKEEVDLEKYVPKDQFSEAEKLIGTQGEELGRLRKLETFVDEISPVLDKLDDKMIDAIISGKFDSNLAESVLSGKVKIEDATIVAKANEEVKKEVGKEEYKGLSTEEIEKLITAKVNETVGLKSKDIDAKLTNAEKKREEKEFKEDASTFVANTPDYAEHADAINKWLDEHENQYDIRVAYDVVKGKVLGELSKAEAEKQQAEEAKNLAANAAGGGSQGGSFSAGQSTIDDLVGDSSDPNSF